MQHCNTIALLMPIHTKKLNWLYSFLSSINITELDKLNFDIVLLVSNEEEKIQITRAIKVILKEHIYKIKMLDIDLYIKEVLVKDEILDRYRKNTDRCIVNLKKFVGLHWSMQFYEYVSMIDCDTIFKNKNTLSLCHNQLISNYHKNLYFGGETANEVIYETLKSCANFFSTEQQEKIREFTKDFSVYPWFFDVPFYKQDDLKEFFGLMLNGDFWCSQNWHSFEHIIFIYFRCLYKECRLVNYTDDLRAVVPEQLSIRELIALKYKYGYMPVWARLVHVIHHSIELIEDESICLLYHTDRI